MPDTGLITCLATRLHRDPTCAEALERVDRTDRDVGAGPRRATAPPATSPSPTDAAASSSPASNAGSATPLRTAELVARTEAKLVRAARPGARRRPRRRRARSAAPRNASSDPPAVARLFDVEIAEGRFLYHYNDAAFAYEELLAGRYVLTTSLSRRPTPPPPRSSPSTANSSTSSTASACSRTSCTCAPCGTGPNAASAATSPCASTPRSSKHSSTRALAAADVRDPDLADQHLTAARALRELHRIRDVTLTAGDHTIDAVTRRNPLQARILAALDVDTTSWDHAHIH